jgi:hypothetical protein
MKKILTGVFGTPADPEHEEDGYSYFKRVQWDNSRRLVGASSWAVMPCL